MAEENFDQYEHYNFSQDKYLNAGNSGKQRTKKEAAEHTNHFDPSGHSRKIVTKLINTENNAKLGRKKSNSTSSNGSNSGSTEDAQQNNEA